jgi:hypothetical protein
MPKLPTLPTPPIVEEPTIDDIISNLPEEDEDDWMDFDDDDDDFFDEPKKKDLNPSRPKKSKDLTLSRFG